MTLRFEVNQAEAFRQGVNVQKSTSHVDVDPAAISQEERNLIADRLHGIDVCELDSFGERLFTSNDEWDETTKPYGGVFVNPKRIVASLPTYETLIDAIRDNEQQVDRRMTVCTLLVKLQELLKKGRNGNVYITEYDNPKKGQLPVDNVRLENDNGIGVAVLTTSATIDTKNVKQHTIKSLIERLRTGFPENGGARAEFLSGIDGAVKVREIRQVQWRTLTHYGENPMRESVVAVEVA